MSDEDCAQSPNDNNEREEQEEYDKNDREAIRELIESFGQVSSRIESTGSSSKNQEIPHELSSIMSRRGEEPRQDLIEKYQKKLDKPLPNRVNASLFPGGSPGVTITGPSCEYGEENTTKNVSIDEGASKLGKKSCGTYESRRYKRKRREKRKRKRKLRKRGTLFSSSEEEVEESQHSSAKSAFFVSDKDDDDDEDCNQRRQQRSSSEAWKMRECSESSSHEDGFGIAKRKSKAVANSLRKAILEREHSSSVGRGSDSSSHDVSQEIQLKGQGSRTSSEDGGHHIITENGLQLMPVSNDPMSMAERERKYGNSGDPRTCFLCQFGNIRYDSMVSTKINELWNLIASNYFETTDTEGLAAAAYSYYVEEIYEEGISNGQDLPRWSEQGMYAHITQHMGDPRIFLGESIKGLSMMKRMLMSMCIQTDDAGSMDADMKKFAEIRMLTKQMLDLYKSDPQSMFGYCDAFKADPSGMHRLVHMSRVHIQGQTSIQSSRGTFS